MLGRRKGDDALLGRATGKGRERGKEGVSGGSTERGRERDEVEKKDVVMLCCVVW